jgi:hypothetical protein
VLSSPRSARSKRSKRKSGWTSNLRFMRVSGRTLRCSKAREERVADRYNRARILATLPKKRSTTGPEHLCLS